MGKTDTEGLLLNLGKSYTKAKNKGSVYFTLKRCMEYILLLIKCVRFGTRKSQIQARKQTKEPAY